MKWSLSAQEELDIYNYVGENTCLSHQNVLSLTSEAFRRSEKNPNQIFNTIAVISEDRSLDDSLRDEILKFIGREPQLEKASIALVRGRINAATRQIEGNTHWTALNLRRFVGADGRVSIEINHMDSMGGDIPSAVTRVIQGIKETEYRNLSPDLQQNAPCLRALAILQDITFKRPVALECARQQDVYSCGYHTAFNLVMMHDDLFTNQYILQGTRTVRVVDFIREGKLYLQGQFNSRVDQARTVSTSKLSSKQSTSSVEDKKTLSQSSDITDLDTAVACVFSIIEDPNLSYIKKLEGLFKIEKQLRTEETFEKILSPLKIEKIYGMVIGEFLESIRFSLSKKNKLSPEAEEFLQLLNTPATYKDPEKIILFLSELEILSKSLEDAAVKDENLQKISPATPKLPDQFLAEIDKYTKNLQLINNSITKAPKSTTPKTSPTPPLSAERAQKIQKVKEGVKKLIAGEKDVLPETKKAFEEDIQSQKNKPKPKLPYPGLGLAVKAVKQEVSGKKVMMLKINEDFNPKDKRFEYESESNRRSTKVETKYIDPVGKYIVWIKTKDGHVSIEDIFKRHGEDKDAAKKEIAGICHNNEDTEKIKFGVFDPFTNKIVEVSCDRKIYVTSNCGFAKDKLGAKRGALYNPDIHHVSDNVLKTADIAMSRAG